MKLPLPDPDPVPTLVRRMSSPVAAYSNTTDFVAANAAAAAAANAAAAVAASARTSAPMPTVLSNARRTAGQPMNTDVCALSAAVAAAAATADAGVGAGEAAGVGVGEALALAALAADAAAGALEQARPPTPAQPNSPLPACLHRAPGFQSVGRVGCPGGPQTTPSRGGKGDLVCHAWPMVSSETPALTRERPQWRCW